MRTAMYIETNTSLPLRVQAAMNYLQYCSATTHQCDPTAPEKKLTNAENAVKNSALTVLRLYLECEMDYVDPKPAEKAEPKSEESPMGEDAPEAADTDESTD